MPLIKCEDGILRTYAEFEDKTKPIWWRNMVKEDNNK